MLISLKKLTKTTIKKCRLKWHYMKIKTIYNFYYLRKQQANTDGQTDGQTAKIDRCHVKYL